jgi:hypothetical protein
MSQTMYDSVDVGQIPVNATAVAGYTSGNWPTYNEIVAKFPKAHHLSIAVNASHDADVLDCEAGDASISEAPAWFKRQIAKGKKLPCIYTSLSNVNALHSIMEAAGISRDQWRLWSAHYTGSPHICGPREGISTVADGTQYYDKALGRNLDVSLVDDDFFGEVPKPVNTWQPPDEHNWCVEWDRIIARKTVAAHLRRLFLRGQMLLRRRKITALAKKSGWKVENRLYRYEQLQKRSK